MTAATVDSGADWDAGVRIIERLARRGKPFSANDVRDKLRALGFGRHNTGTLFLHAKQQGVIREVGLVKTSSRPTNGKRLSQWIGARP